MRLLVTSIALACLGFVSPALAQLSFSNQTTAAGISSTYKPAGFVPSEYIGPGACGDMNDDGWQDLFLLSGGETNGPDKLYINQGDGTFVDRAAVWSLSAVHRGTGIAVGDYDNDGYLDTYVTSVGITGPASAGQNKLYRNQNGQGFIDLAFSAGVTGLASDSYGAAFGDYDLDGNLDLFCSSFYTTNSQLYRNQGNGTFANATTSSGLSSEGLTTQIMFAARFADMDGDRYPELLAVGDFGTSRYYKNNGDGSFSYMSPGFGTGKEENGMGQAVGDFNRDGRFDWYVTSILSDSPGMGWTGNKLYMNIGSHAFNETSLPAGVSDGGYGWAAVAADFDHDRWLDIAETNGANWHHEWKSEPAYLWLNNGNSTFSEVSQQVGFVNIGQSRGLILFDYDLDGDQDLFLTETNQPAELWRNDLQGPNTHWLRVSLDTSDTPTAAPNGYGSVVRVTAGGIQQTGHVFGGDNYQSQSELTAHFGLGAETSVSELRVEWPDGQVTVLTNVSADQHITVKRSWWTDLDGGVDGTNGSVSLQGTGSLTAGSPTTIGVENALPSVSGLLFVGVTELNVPLYGGTFWPTPHAQIPIPTDASGNLLLPISWPVLPPGTSIWMQAWFADPGGTFGASASNGLRVIVP